ncbi:TPA: TIGR03749 family integrating conjugative element protein [Legionella pneumophila]
MKTVKWLLSVFILISSQYSFADNAEHVLWDKTPIVVDLSLNEERLVQFPQGISIIENEASDKMTILKVQDSLYIKAKEQFQNKRLIIQLMPQGEVIILNISADNKAHGSKPLRVLLEQNSIASNTTNQQTNPMDLNAISLTRFAIQSLYAPQRVLVVPEGVGRVPMQTRKQISLFYGASIEARPLISWQGGSFYITAVELTNLLNIQVTVDPRQMVGNWQSASFYPTNTLMPRGKEDTTTVFLVSDRPFSIALGSSREYVR